MGLRKSITFSLQ